jgi:hypothetical protein
MRGLLFQLSYLSVPRSGRILYFSVCVILGLDLCVLRFPPVHGVRAQRLLFNAGLFSSSLVSFRTGVAMQHVLCPRTSFTYAWAYTCALLTLFPQLTPCLRTHLCCICSLLWLVSHLAFLYFWHVCVPCLCTFSFGVVCTLLILACVPCPCPCPCPCPGVCTLCAVHMCQCLRWLGAHSTLTSCRLLSPMLLTCLACMTLFWHTMPSICSCTRRHSDLHPRA